LIAVAKEDEDQRRRRVNLTSKGVAELTAYDRLSDNLAASMLEPLEASEQRRLLAAMSEVERLIRAASVKVAAESADGADARLCLTAYFRELAARFEGGFDDADDYAGVEDMTPPIGLFVIARLDGDAVGCGGFKRVDKATGEIKRVWTAPSARGMGIARRILRTLEAAAREKGLKTLRLDTNRALTEAHALYRSEGYQKSLDSTTIPTPITGSRSGFRLHPRVIAPTWRRSSPRVRTCEPRSSLRAPRRRGGRP
jgi:GNAT superfamily N-acetyltransferase